MNIIAGDIGGTKSWLAWVEAGGQAMEVRFEQVYPSADFASADALLQQFMADAQQASKPDVVCLALPGPVQDTQPITLTNLDWTLEKSALQALLDTPELVFINDFQAAAAGVATLTADDYVVLNPGMGGEGASSVRVITGAGTGLGLAWMQADASGHYHTLCHRRRAHRFRPRQCPTGTLAGVYAPTFPAMFRGNGCCRGWASIRFTSFAYRKYAGTFRQTCASKTGRW